MSTFYGYGSYAGPYWFIGLKENGGQDIGDIEARLNTWQARGKPELDDAPGFCAHLAQTRPEHANWFASSPDDQLTWQGAIRIILALEQSKVAVPAYQRDHFGRHTSNHCFMNLTPLPRPKTDSEWQYQHWSLLPELASSKKYEQAITNLRVTHLRQAIQAHKPEIVVFFGSRPKDWEAIAGRSLDRWGRDDLKMKMASDGHTVYASTIHPSATKWHGGSTAYFTAIANEICEFIGA